MTDRDTNTPSELLFAVKYPCIYENNIICNDCDRNECDMKAGRVLHEKKYKSGFIDGIEYATKYLLRDKL